MGGRIRPFAHIGYGDLEMREFVTRGIRALAVLIVVALAIPTTAVLIGTQVADNASAATAEYYVKVGWLSDVQGWNPMNIEMVEDYVACYLMFSCLFTYDEDWNLLQYDLATNVEQVPHAAGNMTTYIDITENAYFRNLANPTDMSHPLTADDVVYTLTRIIANPGGAWDWYLGGIVGINKTSEFRVQIDTEGQSAVLLDNLASIPIIPMYQWVSITDSLFLKESLDPDELVGSGPFFYNSSASGSWYRFTTAPHYHGATDYPIGDPRGERVIDFDGILYTVFTDVSAMTIAMNDGTQDAIALWGEPNLYLNALGDGASVEITKFAVQEPGICDVAVNAIPLSFRTPNYGTGNVILLDPVVREAIMTTMDKDHIVNETMFGLATRADSVVQPNFWQKDIENKLVFDTTAAGNLLEAAGYRDTNTDGIREVTSDALVSEAPYNVDVGTELSFRCEAPDTDPSYEAVGRYWATMALEAGILLNYETKSESVMINQAWYQADYDIWVWHWGWGPEPIGGSLSCWLTEEIVVGGDNCQTPMGPWWYGPDNCTAAGYDGPYSAFDENMDAALVTLDKDERKVLLDECQQWIYDSHTENPPFYDLGLYGITKERFDGWGDWESHPGRTVVSDLLWVWFDLYAQTGNFMPEVSTPLSSDYVVTMDVSFAFEIGIIDNEGDPLTVNWTFGDGGSAQNITTADSTSEILFRQDYAYTTESPVDGYDLIVTAWDGNSGNTATARATVYVSPEPDTVPYFTSPVIEDPPVAYIGESVSWTVGATDDESTALTITWDWDDLTASSTTYTITPSETQSDTKTHSWDVSGTYYVEVFIDDGSGLPNHNISSGQIAYEVIENTAAEISISSINGGVDLWTECVATATDADGDPLTFTWEWDDATVNVTQVDSDPGMPVTSTVAHMWTSEGSFPVTVWVDDGQGNNVSDTVDAFVTAGNVPPSSMSLTATPNAPMTGEDVVFNASAIDVDSEALTFTMDFGDGSDLEVGTTADGIATRQYMDFTHAYDAADTYTVIVYADDGSGLTDHNVTGTISVTVSDNAEPWLSIGSSMSAKFNRTVTVTPTVCRDNDSDPLSVWYDWGDGTGSAGVEPYFAGSHVYTVIGEQTMTVYAYDGFANVSKSAIVTVSDNQRPSFAVNPTATPTGTLEPGTEVTFTIIVRDYEGDQVNISIDFGDGSELYVDTFRPVANTNTSRSVTHVFEDEKSTPYSVVITVNDGMGQYHYVTSWESKTVSITVESPNGGLSTLAIAGIAMAVLVIVGLVAYMVMKRKKKGPSAEEGGSGMEGMAPPEPPPRKE